MQRSLQELKVGMKGEQWRETRMSIGSLFDYDLPKLANVS
jgi:hypothetical protein